MSEPVPKDVTYQMNGNYFLFATLENARVMANGRMGQNDQKGLPMLTGTPVAGMVCLDRPQPAGYFIFPDLSVRHEGSFRLGFSLYEELREAKDEDHGEDLSRSAEEESHVTHRLEVKSEPFLVYSAKKFPGLTESTSLSRVVAEQGCRVRIRRDVRMRKRESKTGKDWEGYEDETADARTRMSSTPETTGYGPLPTPHGFREAVPRPRSSSNASHHSLAPSLTLSRRPSQQEMSQAYHPPMYSTAPHTPHTAFLHTSPYGPSPTQSYLSGPFTQQQSSMQPPPPQYQQHPYQPPPPMSQAPMPPQGYHTYSSAPAPPPPMHYGQYPPPPHGYEAQDYHHRMSVEYGQPQYDHRRSSSNFTAPPPPAVQPSYPPPHQPTYQPPPPPQYQPTYTAQKVESYGHRPPPLEPVQPPARTAGGSTPISARTSFENKTLPPIGTLNMPPIPSNKFEASSPSSAGPHSGYPPMSAGSQTETNKRGYSQVFRESHLNQPLRHGARPSEAVQPPYPSATEADDSESATGSYEEPHRTAKRCDYRRADGRAMQRYMDQEQN